MPALTLDTEHRSSSASAPATMVAPVDRSRTERSAARVRERGIELLEEAAEQSRPRMVADRLAGNARWFVQAALVTALSWQAAILLFGHPRPIFAPVAGLIAVSTTLGQRRRYAIEMVVGIAVGVGIADVLFVLIGGGTVQIAAIVAGAMAAAVALGGSVVLVSEAGVSALLVVTIQPPSSGLSGARFLDSLLGGLIALAVTSLLPANPVRATRRAAALPLAQIAATLEEIARALDRVDQGLAERALVRARSVDRQALADAVAAGRETLQLAPFARETRARFARYVRAEAQIDVAITSVEALAAPWSALCALGTTCRLRCPRRSGPGPGGPQPGGIARRSDRRDLCPRACAARRRQGDAGARADRQPVSQRDRGAGPRGGR